MAQPRASRTWILSAWRASCESFSYTACVTKAESCSTYVILVSLFPYLNTSKERNRQTDVFHLLHKAYSIFLTRASKHARGVRKIWKNAIRHDRWRHVTICL